MLPPESAGSYDYGRDPRVAEALMNEREAKSISAVAATLRAEIVGGMYGGKDAQGRDRRVPSRNDIAERFGVSAESGGVVLRMLAAEGLIRMEQGRGTYAEPVARHRAVVTVRRRDRAVPTSEWSTRTGRRLQGLGEADLADPDVVASSGAEADICVTVIAGDAGFAAARASAVVRALLGAGWEITGAAARPA